MKIDRRSFIKWTIGGLAGSLWPFPRKAFSESSTKRGIPSGLLRSETNTVCHKIYAGEKLPLPEPSRSYDLVIVGGGPSGLAAADYAQKTNFLLLEKESYVGGVARAESWEGLKYTTGSSVIADYALAKKLFDKWRLPVKEIKTPDMACFNGTWVSGLINNWQPDNPAIEQLPYAESVKKSIRQFCRDISKMWLLKKLDTFPFSDILKNYTPVLKTFWDTYGPAIWGAVSEETSAYLGVQAAKYWRLGTIHTMEGGLGVAIQKICEQLSDEAKKRILLNATVYKIRRRDKRVLITFMKEGESQTVSAAACVLAIPKHTARFIVEDIPQEQILAMQKIRYAPYLIYNLCFDRVVYNQAFDNWVIGAKNLTDFLVADYVTYANGGDLNRKQIITVEAPLRESERLELLDDAIVLTKARKAVEELLELFPGWLNHLKEVRIYRRGHPMFMATPGFFTKIQPVAGRDLSPIFFAHTDSKGEVSQFTFAVLNGNSAAKKALKYL